MPRRNKSLRIGKVEWWESAIPIVIIALLIGCGIFKEPQKTTGPEQEAYWISAVNEQEETVASSTAITLPKGKYPPLILLKSNTSSMSKPQTILRYELREAIINP